VETNKEQLETIEKMKNYNGEMEVADCNGTIVINKEGTNRFLFIDTNGAAKLRLCGNNRIIDRVVNA